MVHDLRDDPTTASDYECLECGAIVTAENNPVSCPDCGRTVQNRANSLE